MTTVLMKPYGLECDLWSLGITAYGAPAFSLSLSGQGSDSCCVEMAELAPPHYGVDPTQVPLIVYGVGHVRSSHPEARP
jgi:hypothetical protein